MPKRYISIFEMRLTIPVSIDRLIEEGKASNEKKAFKVILERLQKKNIDLGFNDDIDKAYNSYRSFKTKYKKHI